MRKLLALVALLASAGLLIALAALAPACGEGQTCESVMGHFYSLNCTITSGGTAISEGEAVEWCEQAKVDATNCGCSAALQDVLDCLDASGTDQCSLCGTQFETTNACFNAC
ncbi:MAG TPA: hypothetical protein PK668_26630 [Myxococcota bacterium]|nr:hypothetical protein [Myxococcota bacterium]HRY97105.1 hypothetical protein [Myxococcota bacterium]HSA23585.1 hypothetical protein [Myxococcota bacterium]